MLAGWIPTWLQGFEREASYADTIVVDNDGLLVYNKHMDIKNYTHNYYLQHKELSKERTKKWRLNHKTPCPNCGKLIDYRATRCLSCASKVREQKKYEATGHSRFWKGGHILRRDGYIMVWLTNKDFFFPMTVRSCRDYGGYVLEHRLVVAKHLGRCLQPWEIVHHKHAKYPAGSIEDKQDNRYPENLQLVSDDRHKQITVLEQKIKRLEDKIKRQAELIKSLQVKKRLDIPWQIE